MNENNSKVSMYEAVPVVSELNKVSGFDPLKYLRKTKNGWNLDLKIKKLWFRLKYPAGRTRMVTVKITDQLAIMEARVYFDKNDTQPAANFTAQRESKSTPGGLYIEAAQHEAMDEALTAAGFGIQFIPANALEAEQAEKHVLVTKQEPEPQQAAPSVAEKISPETAETKAETAAEAVTQESAAPETVEEEVTPAAEAEKAVMSEQHAAEETEAAPVPASQEEVAAEDMQEESSEIQEAEEHSAAYTNDMSMDEICAVMTVEEAENIIVPAGTCKGWTLSQVAERRPVSLKWYLTGYSGDDNILRAGARIMQSVVEAKKAS